jgi:hypothetical protein
MKIFEHLETFRVVGGIATAILLVSCSDIPHGPRIFPGRSSSGDAPDDRRATRDIPDEVEPPSDELSNSPAYQYAAHGNYDKARSIVAAGEDTREHLNMGIKYHIDHQSFGELMSEGVQGFNKLGYKTIKKRAENGDPGAQKWMEEKGPTFKAGTDAVKAMNDNSTPPESSNQSGE